MINNACYLGKLNCIGLADKLVVDIPNSIHLQFTVGRYGIDDGGNLKIAWAGVSDWQAPQMDNPSGMGYSTVFTSGSANVTLTNCEGMRPFENAVRIHVSNGCLAPGDTIDLVLGDRTFGSAGIVTQSVAEQEHRFVALVDPFGSNRYEELAPPVVLQVYPGTCARIGVVLPSTVRVGEAFRIHIRILDAYGNACSDFSGGIQLKLPQGLRVDRTTVQLTPDNQGAVTLSGTVDAEGTYQVSAESTQYALQCTSNLCKSVAADDYRLFWGDMHGQNALASGLGSMEDSLRFARDIGALDFTGWQGNDFEVSDENWARVSETLRAFNEPHRFLTFLGYEWSGITSAGGDHNIYFLSDAETIRRSSQWLYRPDGQSIGLGREDDGTDRYPISALWENLHGRKDAMAIAHVGGRYANFDFYDPEIIRVIEIYSHHGMFDWFLEEAMRRRMKVGFIAASDDHTSRLGLSYPICPNSDDFGSTFDVQSGLTAVYAKELTKEAIWEALRARHCYAATSSRSIVEFFVNDSMMGDEIEIVRPPEIRFRVKGSSAIDRVEVYRGTDRIRCFRGTGQQPADIGKYVRIVWSGVATRFRKKSVTWDGTVFVKEGRIESAENYAVDRYIDGVRDIGNQRVGFRSKTAGDEDGMILHIIPAPGGMCTILFASCQKTVSVRYDEISQEALVFAAGGLDCKVSFDEVGKYPQPEKASELAGSFRDDEFRQGMEPYYIKAYHVDGSRAWSSPVFVTGKKEPDPGR